MQSNPLIVQSDFSILLDLHTPLADEARDAIAPFAELVKSPEHIHTYQITPLSIWNAIAAGSQPRAIIQTLNHYAKFPFAEAIEIEIKNLAERYGLIQMEYHQGRLLLITATPTLAELLYHTPSVQKYIQQRVTKTTFEIALLHRGTIKQTLIHLGYPVQDLAGFEKGDSLAIDLATHQFELRDYQQNAVQSFHNHRNESGHGVIVLPCGAGKTIVGLAAMAMIQEQTLILTTGVTSVRQWQRELLDKTSLSENDIAEYTGQIKNTAPVTLTTYQMLSYRPDRESDHFPHFELFNQRAWGLIIYDEVHLLPAPVFRITAEIQAKKRLGLTATLIREDGKENDVFALIGPKRFDVPWKVLESTGFIAKAVCHEIRIPQSPKREMDYALTPNRQRFRFASENPNKQKQINHLLKRHKTKRILIIGEYITQIETIAQSTGFPIITGKTKQSDREALYHQFRTGSIPGLILSRVGNFAVDLPDAEVLIQVSGKYGSRQEEAQRLGRILRPKKDGRGALFFTLVSSKTCEEDFARKRQRFLTEQGYEYHILSHTP